MIPLHQKHRIKIAANLQRTFAFYFKSLDY